MALVGSSTPVIVALDAVQRECCRRCMCSLAIDQKPSRLSPAVMVCPSRHHHFSADGRESRIEAVHGERTRAEQRRATDAELGGEGCVSGHHTPLGNLANTDHSTKQPRARRDPWPVATLTQAGTDSCSLTPAGTRLVLPYASWTPTRAPLTQAGT